MVDEQHHQAVVNAMLRSMTSAHHQMTMRGIATFLTQRCWRGALTEAGSRTRR